MSEFAEINLGPSYQYEDLLATRLVDAFQATLSAHRNNKFVRIILANVSMHSHVTELLLSVRLPCVHVLLSVLSTGFLLFRR